MIFMAKAIAAMGFKIFASEGTWKVLSSNGINVKMVPKIGEGKPDIIDLIKGNDIDLIINVPAGRKSQIDSKPIRSAAVSQGVPYITTLEGAQAAISGMDSLERTGFSVKPSRNMPMPVRGEAGSINTILICVRQCGGEMAKYIFVTGGVVSSLGKGITAASIGLLLKSRGLRVIHQKFDPYLNVDPGTMNPYQHGEVYVTDDGAETDLDLGHYERFTGATTTRNCNFTSGRIYDSSSRRNAAAITWAAPSRWCRT